MPGEKWAPGRNAARCPRPPGAAEEAARRQMHRTRSAGCAGTPAAHGAGARAQEARPGEQGQAPRTRQSQAWERTASTGGGRESPPRPLAGFPPVRGRGPRRAQSMCRAPQPGLRLGASPGGGRRLGPAGRP